MKWFKMMWLSSKERATLKEAEERSSRPTPVATTEEYLESLKPYKKIIYSNGNLTVILKDGSILSRSNAPAELFTQVRDATSESQINFLLLEPAVVQKDNDIETPEERRLVADNLGIFRDNSDFTIRGTDLYLKGVNLAIPAPIVVSFIEILEKIGALEEHYMGDVIMTITKEYSDLEEKYEALRMFWLKLALNPLEQSREDLLIFVRKNDVRITRNGNLILYRRIVTKEGADTKFVTFVTQSYYAIKKEGFDPRQFAVGKLLDEYSLIDLNEYEAHDDPNEAKPFINLQQAYLELPTYETNTFTAAHDRKVDIRLGGIYKIPEDKINLDNGLCAAGGLHAAAVDYNYSGFGDMPVVVLVNPSKAITVPRGETGKLRTTEMFVACVNDKPQGTHFDEDGLAAFDVEYHDKSLEELEEAAKNKSFQGLSVQDQVPAISLVDLNTIKDMLRNRITVI